MAESDGVWDLTEAIIGAAIEVHRALGLGLLESAYEECLCFELHARGLPFERQRALPVVYKTVHLECAYASGRSFTPAAWTLTISRSLSLGDSVSPW